MRIVAWNCCGKFSAKYEHLEDLDFDVAVVAECGPLSVDASRPRDLTYELVQPIAGSHKHLGVFARDPWRVAPDREIPSAPWLLPMRVTGPHAFTVLGFWGADPGRFGPYPAQLRRVLEEVLPGLDGDVVVAGDFNAPIASTHRAHAENVALLAQHGLVSAYDATRDEDEPIEPTYYHQMREDQPFHIDHVFVPQTWTRGLSMTVGRYAEWVSSKRSDHVPLIADIDLRTPRPVRRVAGDP